MKNKIEIEILTLAAGPEGTYYPGQVYLFDVEKAEVFVKAGAAKYRTPPSSPVSEATVMETPEKAVLPSPQRRKVVTTKKRRG